MGESRAVVSGIKKKWFYLTGSDQKYEDLAYAGS